MSTNLKTLCKLAGIKQTSLAKEVGVAQGVISDWQNGKYYPSAENVIKLTKILNVSAGCILGLEPVPEGYPDHNQIPFTFDVNVYTQTPVDTEEKIAPKTKNAPFSQSQMDFLSEWGDQLLERVTDTLREDTSLLKRTDVK